MADIEKIVSEEIDKVKSILNNANNIFLKGNEDFNNIMNEVILWAYRDDSEKYLKDCEFFIIKDIKKSVKRFTFFFKERIQIFSVLFPMSSKSNLVPYITFVNLLRKKCERHIENDAIEAKSIPFDDILDLKIDKDVNFKNDFLKVPKVFNFNIRKRQEVIRISTNDIFNAEDIIAEQAITSLIENIYKRIKNEDNEFKLLIEKFNKIYFENEDWEKSINILNKIIDIYPEDFHLFCYKANCMIEIGNLEEANILLQKSLSNFKKSLNFEKIENWDEGDKDFFSFLKAIEAKLYESKNQILKSIQSTNESLEFTEDQRLKEIRLSRKNERVNKLIDSFTELKYNTRKVIYLDNELSFINPNNIVPLEISMISTLKFPPSHPVPGQLYVGHPFKSELYYPIEEYENYLLESQVMELSHLLKSLGAKKITTEHTIGSSIEQNQENKNLARSQTNQSDSVGVQGAIYSADVKIERGKNQQSNTELASETSSMSKKSMNIDGVFKPKYKPYIPNDLVWFEHNEIWQSLAKQRLEGGLESYNITLSTRNIEQISERELKAIDNEYKLLLKGSAGVKLAKGNFEHQSDKSNSQTSESLLNMKKKGNTELRIYVEFAPLEELLSDTTSNSKNSNESKTKKEQSNLMNEEEIEYMEVVKELVESNKINDTLRRILERSRSKLGISEVRASEIENIVLNQTNYTKEELEFLEEIKFCLEDDGVISQEESKFLEKLKNKLNITDKRANELEKLLIEYQSTKKMDNWLKRKLINFLNK